MNLFRSLKTLLMTTRSKPCQSRTGRRYYPRFECLEHRLVMNADIDLHNGVLEIEGTDLMNTINIYHRNPADPRSDVIAEVIEHPVINGVAVSRLLVREDHDAGNVNSIHVWGRDGIDAIFNYTSLPSIMEGEGGADMLYSGGGNDRLIGGS